MCRSLYISGPFAVVLHIFSRTSLAVLVFPQTHAVRVAATTTHKYVHPATRGLHSQHAAIKQIKSTGTTLTPPAGLEPAIFGLEVRRLVH